MNFLYCHEDPKQAAAIGMRMVGLFGLANAHLFWTREAYPTRAYQSLANLAPSRAAGGGNPADPCGMPEGIGVGDPEAHRASDQALGVDRRRRHQLPR